MGTEEDRDLLNPLIDIYKQGFNDGYDAASKKYQELLALARIGKEEAAQIMKASIKPEYRERLTGS